MFGSCFRMKPKAGKAEAITKMMNEEMGGPGAIAGFRASAALQEANGDIWVMAIFDDEKSYRANANSPEQDKRYRRLREMLEADPEWHDGNILDFQSR